MMTVAEMIKKTRTEANMTQEEYGLKFGVTRQTVSSWENERSLPDLQMLIDICNIYHVSLDKLLNEDKAFVEKIDFYSKYKKAIRLVGMSLIACFLIFTVIFINWKITEGNMNREFERNAKNLGFVKEKIYELEKDHVCCKCQYKNAQKVENKNVHFPTILPRIVFPKRLAFP